MALTDKSLIGLANRFKVTVIEQSSYDLGSWQKAEGLDVTWDVPEFRAGDAGNSRWFYPANTKYTPVKLMRAATAEESPKVKAWLDANSFTQSKSRGLVTIQLCDSMGIGFMTWELRQALPRKWGITNMDAGASQVSIETLEFDHEGFLDDHTAM